MSKNDSIWDGFLDVVILPPPEVRDYAIELSAKLHEEYGAPWKLGFEERLPHISLFHFPLNPERDVEGVMETLTINAEPSETTVLKGGELKLTGISSPHHGVIFLNVDRPMWLIIETEEISRILWGQGFAFEDARFMERWGIFDTISERMQENMKWWGSPIMGDDFVPHFTLGIVNKERASEIATSLTFQPMSWMVDHLHIVQVGENGTAREVLGEIPLKNA